MGPLPFCAKEAEAINTLLPESIPREILLKPTRAELWRKINKCSVAHFACHGGVEHNPSKSKIYLEDWQTCPLTVGDIAALKLDHAPLAYLSACHTTSSLDYRLFDEAIHMAGACQLAGFPNVVGTLWHASYSQSAILTEEFYRLLLDKDEKLDFKSTARALHFAMRKIRDGTSQRADVPVVWAPYIHLGV
jgi:CHAT domain-containing protein